MLAPSQTGMGPCAKTVREKTMCTRWQCPLRTSRVIDQSHPSSPGQWPPADSCCYCWWARPNTAAIYQPCWLRQARENTESFWLCADGKSSAQTNVRTIVWAVSKHPPASKCFHSGRIHFFVPPTPLPPIWETSKRGVLRNLNDIYEKNAVPKTVPKLAVHLHWGPSHMASARSQLWCFFGICSLHRRYEILFSFFLPCDSLDNPWYLDGSVSLAAKKRMAGVTANGISRMRFGIFSFMRPARCYLAV